MVSLTSAMSSALRRQLVDEVERRDGIRRRAETVTSGESRRLVIPRVRRRLQAARAVKVLRARATVFPEEFSDSSRLYPADCSRFSTDSPRTERWSDHFESRVVAPDRESIILDFQASFAP